jgi:hypothetical protein
MDGSEGLAADYPGVPLRPEVHDHSMVGVDQALTTFPNQTDQAAAIANQLLTTASNRLCVMPDLNDTVAMVTLDNVAVGHDFPSGASQDRRAWVEVIAYLNGQQIYSSGSVPDDQAVGVNPDPDLWLFSDTTLDANGKPTHDFWSVARNTSVELPPSVTNDASNPLYYHSRSKSYRIVGQQADKVTARVQMRPIGLEIIDDLVSTGDLDAKYRALIPLYTLQGTVWEWDLSKGYGCVPF